MREKLVIVGAGGQGLVAFETAESLNIYDEILILDNPTKLPTPVKVDYSLEKLEEFIDSHHIFVAIIDNLIRMNTVNQLVKKGFRLVNLIHKSSVVSNSAKLGLNIFIGPLSNINAGSIINIGTIINSAVSVDHNCEIGEFCHLAPGVIMAGNVKLGNLSFIGTNATVINNLKITSGVVIGAGALVIRDLEEKATYIGVPAKKMSY
jgi:UDP-N-acetylbacillosamine N-acetyltransferase